MNNNSKPMSATGLTDKEIIDGLRKGNAQITQDYFYGTCSVAYHIYDKQYNLRYKTGLDFYSIAHEYYLSLAKHDFHQLEDRKPTMTLKTWMVNGFRFVVLDRMKAYNKENGIQSFEERMEKANLRFDIPDNNFSEDFRKTVKDICTHILGRDTRSSLILQMILIDGFKGKEAAKQLGITPSAVTQRYHKLMKDVVVPYFKRYYVASEPNGVRYDFAPRPSIVSDACMSLPKGNLNATNIITENMNTNYKKRITPDYVSELKPNEIFVFGSNLAGMHGGGAARTARLHFGAILGNGDGPQGQSYAIPTMQGGVETIRPYVDKFIAYAKSHPELTFLVTPIGCGIAGFNPKDIAPLFNAAIKVENIHLPQSFWDNLID